MVQDESTPNIVVPLKPEGSEHDKPVQDSSIGGSVGTGGSDDGGGGGWRSGMEMGGLREKVKQIEKQMEERKDDVKGVVRWGWFAALVPLLLATYGGLFWFNWDVSKSIKEELSDSIQDVSTEIGSTERYLADKIQANQVQMVRFEHKLDAILVSAGAEKSVIEKPAPQEDEKSNEDDP